LNHFKFRQLLQAKCAVKGKSLVVDYEMSTSRTCGRCYRLHSEVFTCPFCSYRAGQDENAALNILLCEVFE
jgi:transposase